MLCVSYRQEKAAVLFQSTQEAQKGHTSDDYAQDQKHVGYANAGQVWSECSHLELHNQVHTQTQHCHATHLTKEICMHTGPPIKT